MIIKSLHDLFRKAHCSETRIEQLQELVNLENEALCAAVALHPNCNKSLLEKTVAARYEYGKRKPYKAIQHLPEAYTL